MAPARVSSVESEHLAPALEEIIFSCGVCQATVSELYPANVDNPNSHSDTDDGMGVKLWIADCVHVFCGRHLEGGGVPFHSRDQPPQAICPICVRADNSHEVRNLYGIRGLTDDKLDPAIPSDYVKCPPVSLDGNDPGVEALRASQTCLRVYTALTVPQFQYSRMKSYSQEVTKRWKSADRKRRTVESTLHKERKQHRKLQADYEALRERDEELQKKLSGWEARKVQIRHYMGAVAEMARDIQMMRRELKNLGYHVEMKTYGLEAIASPQNPRAAAPRPIDSSTTLVDEKHHTSSAKRKRADYEAYPDDEQIVLELAQDDSQAMAPPPLPLPRASQQQKSEAPKHHGATLTRPQVRQFPEKARQRKQHHLQHEVPHGRASASGYDDHVPGSEHLNSLPDLHSMNLNDSTQSRPYNGIFERPSDRAMHLAPPPYTRAQDSHRSQTLGHASANPYSPHGPAQYFGASMEQVRHTNPAASEQRLGIANQGSSYVDPIERSGPVARAHSPGRPPPQWARQTQRPDLRQPAIQRDVAHPHPIAPQPAASVISPFFKSDTARMPESAPRRDARAANHVDAARSEAPASYDFVLPSRVSANRRESRNKGFWSDAYCDATHSDERPDPTGVAAYQNHPEDARRGSDHMSGSLWSSRPAPRPPVASSSRAQVNISQTPSKGRVTLPPASSTQRNWDPQVSQIRGVRGAGPPSSHHYAWTSGVPSYTDRGALHSDRGFSRR
ncbi:hypothetical protein CERZMDRAFT_99455 [Cercospora zeae-maydis SCOH1-5]|uniref:Uncharacterized protein n=1 Tax=Cercospora zeae-maydis SCOH1-5 TaxID=717836 RepID=A0A6A6FAF3_9PEZI|nr:hypothetical protein CERZMDRAFT_99455 [Cercospora zeae-maydis SCOH1-5]